MQRMYVCRIHTVRASLQTIAAMVAAMIAAVVAAIDCSYDDTVSSLQSAIIKVSQNRVSPPDSGSYFIDFF